MRVALPTSDQPSNTSRGWEANNWVAERTGYKKTFMSEEQRLRKLMKIIAAINFSFALAHITNMMSMTAITNTARTQILIPTFATLLRDSGKDNVCDGG